MLAYLIVFAVALLGGFSLGSRYGNGNFLPFDIRVSR